MVERREKIKKKEKEKEKEKEKFPIYMKRIGKATGWTLYIYVLFHFFGLRFFLVKSKSGAEQRIRFFFFFFFFLLLLLQRIRRRWFVASSDCTFSFLFPPFLSFS